MQIIQSISMEPVCQRNVYYDSLWVTFEQKPSLYSLEDDLSLEQTVLYKLRWATLGYHHNWDTKVYDLETHDPFPSSLAELSSTVATLVGYRGYKPQAAIVNYYHPGCTLGGHQDHSELDHDSPIISFSFGLPCIFLIGGSSPNIVPTALLLRHGDIAVMSGVSRLSFHAVPKVMSSCKSEGCTTTNRCQFCAPTSSTLLGTLLRRGMNDGERQVLAEYMDRTRINVNVRQVFPNESS